MEQRARSGQDSDGSVRVPRLASTLREGAQRRAADGAHPGAAPAEDGRRGARPQGARRAPAPTAAASTVRRGGRRAPQGKEAVLARPQGQAQQLRELQKLTITGGSARGRRLVTPEVYMRPMMSRVREAVFSMLTPTGVLRDSATHLDLFAGSGCVGLEALSRGVGRATFVDFSPVCAAAIRKNAEALGFGDRARVVEGRVDDVLLGRPRSTSAAAAAGLGGGDGDAAPYSLVSITPPYEEVVYAELMDAVASSPLIGEDTIILVEYPVELGCFPPTYADGRLVGLRNRKYGRTVIAIYVCRPSGRLDLTPFSEEFVSLR